MLLLCQHSHYVSADSKSLLYLFSRYDIFFLLYFFNYFTFSSLILDVPCLYRQPTAKKTTSSPSYLSSILALFRAINFISHPLADTHTLALCFLSHIPRLSSRHSCIIPLHHPSFCVYKEYYIISFSCHYNIIIGNNIPSVLMHYRYY